MIADISTGHSGFADIMFLVGFVLAVLAAVVSFRPVEKVSAIFLDSLALAAIALGWLVL